MNDVRITDFPHNLYNVEYKKTKFKEKIQSKNCETFAHKFVFSSSESVATSF